MRNIIEEFFYSIVYIDNVMFVLIYRYGLEVVLLKEMFSVFILIEMYCFYMIE